MRCAARVICLVIIILTVYFRPTTKTAKAHIHNTRQYIHDTGIDQIQVHKIINTEAK